VMSAKGVAEGVPQVGSRKGGQNRKFPQERLSRRCSKLVLNDSPPGDVHKWDRAGGSRKYVQKSGFPQDVL
jgi:hypothetical protein